MTNFYFKNHNIHRSNFSFEIIFNKFGTRFIIFGATYSKFGTTFGKCEPLPEKIRPSCLRHIAVLEMFVKMN